MLNVEPSNLVFFKTYNTEFDEIYITFTNQNGRPLEIESKVNLKMLIIIRYSIKPRKRKHVKGCAFLSFLRNLSDKYGKKILDTAENT